MEENYTRVRQPRPETELPENEMLVTSGGKAKAYITHAHGLLTGGDHKTITLRAMGKAINKTVAIAEILKRRVENLHQVTATSSTEILDIWEPKEETTGLERVEKMRQVSVITITLSTEGLDLKSAGYQAPLSKEEFKPVLDEAAFVGDGGGGGGDDEQGGRKPRRQGQGGRRGRGRGRGRGGRGDGNRDSSAAAGEGEEATAAGGEAKKGRRRGRGKAKKPAGEGEGAGGDTSAPAPEN
jgi:DNA-binding protein